MRLSQQRQSHSLFLGIFPKYRIRYLRKHCESFTNYYDENWGFRMEKYTELEVLISAAKSGDQGAIAALNAIMEKMEQFQ